MENGSGPGTNHARHEYRNYNLHRRMMSDIVSERGSVVSFTMLLNIFCYYYYYYYYYYDYYYYYHLLL